jgi:hypothetical protein
MFGARRRKRRSERAPRACLACKASTGTVWQWLCDGCFGRLPYSRKHEICDARAGRAPHRIFGLSKDAADWLQQQRQQQTEK